MNILNLITKKVHCIHADNSLDDAAKLMCEHDFSTLPVMNQDSGLVGMLTDRDILAAAIETGQRLAEIPVAAALSDDFVCCELHNDSDEVLEMMRLYQVYAIPVINRRLELLGIISLSDFANASLSQADADLDGAGSSDFVAALAAMNRSSDASIRIAR
jgi:CBS domain-containing protein